MYDFLAVLRRQSSTPTQLVALVEQKLQNTFLVEVKMRICESENTQSNKNRLHHTTGIKLRHNTRLVHSLFLPTLTACSIKSNILIEKNFMYNK